MKVLQLSAICLTHFSYVHGKYYSIEMVRVSETSAMCTIASMINKTVLASDTHQRIRSYNFEELTNSHL